MKAPTDHPLLSRLEAIGEVLRRSPGALALIGLGSVGVETSRLDAHSDLDFFVVVEPDHKQRYIERLDWLAAAHPLAWHFRNTVDGHKALMADGVLCEFAVFAPDELPQIPFSPGRLVWRRDGVDPAIATPRRPLPDRRLQGVAWIVGEALSCALVGLKRWHRGERLSAARMVQGHAVDRLIELDTLLLRPTPGVAEDPFNRERRVEQRWPALADELPALVPGYSRTPEAALALLQALQRRGVEVDSAIGAAIEQLARG